MQQINLIIIFDGVCNLCNHTVNFLIKHDKKRHFYYTAMQNKTGKELLRKFQVPKETNSVILIKNDKIYTESDAALEIARLLPYPWKTAFAFKIVPVNTRNKLYRWIAKNRFKWFGKRETCRIPTEDEKVFFL